MTNQEIEQKYYSNTVKVSKCLYDRFMDALDCKFLAEQGRLKDVITYHNKLYTPVNCRGFWNEGQAPRNIITAQEVQVLEHYKGELKPLRYNEHQGLVNAGKRERGYYGQLVSYKGRKYALCETSLLIEPIENKQLKLELL